MHAGKTNKISINFTRFSSLERWKLSLVFAIIFCHFEVFQIEIHLKNKIRMNINGNRNYFWDSSDFFYWNSLTQSFPEKLSLKSQSSKQKGPKNETGETKKSFLKQQQKIVDLISSIMLQKTTEKRSMKTIAVEKSVSIHSGLFSLDENCSIFVIYSNFHGCENVCVFL